MASSCSKALTPILLEALRRALKEVDFLGSKAAELESIKPKFKKFKEKIESILLDIDSSDYDDFVADCDYDERQVLKKLRYVKTGGKKYDHEISYERTQGKFKALLIVIAKDKETRTIGILKCHICLSFDVQIPGLIWNLPVFRSYSSMPLKEKALNSIMKHACIRALKLLGKKELDKA